MDESISSSESSSELPTTIDDDDENFYEKQVLKLTTVASMSSILANILISLTIVKYKNLRKDITYIIILHIITVQILSLLLDEILLWFFTYFGTPLPHYHTEFCVIFVAVRMLNGMSFLVLILLLLNWYIKLYCADRTYEHFCKFYKYTLVLIYAVCISLQPFLTRLCLTRDLFATFYVVLAFQIVMICLSIYMTILQKCRRCPVDTLKDVGLGVSNIIVVFCTPAYLCLVLTYFNVVPVYVVLFADVLATGVFPFILYYLYCYDRNFQMYFKRMFSWRRIGGQDAPVSYNLIYNVDR